MVPCDSRRQLTRTEALRLNRASLPCAYRVTRSRAETASLLPQLARDPVIVHHLLARCSFTWQCRARRGQAWHGFDSAIAHQQVGSRARSGIGRASFSLAPHSVEGVLWV